METHTLYLTASGLAAVVYCSQTEASRFAAATQETMLCLPVDSSHPLKQSRGQLVGQIQLRKAKTPSIHSIGEMRERFPVNWSSCGGPSDPNRGKNPAGFGSESAIIQQLLLYSGII